MHDYEAIYRVSAELKKLLLDQTPHDQILTGEAMQNGWSNKGRQQFEALRYVGTS